VLNASSLLSNPPKENLILSVSSPEAPVNVNVGFAATDLTFPFVPSANKI